MNRPVIGGALGFAAIVVGILGLQYLSHISPLTGPSMNAQLAQMRVAIEHHDEILVLGRRTGEFTLAVNQATGDTTDTVWVRSANLVDWMTATAGSVVALDSRVEKLVVVADSAESRSQANSSAIATLHAADVAHSDAIARATAGNVALANRIKTTENRVAELRSADLQLAEAFNKLSINTDSTRAVADRAVAVVTANQEILAAHDQRLVALEAVNTFLYTGNDSALVVAVANGNVDSNFVAGMEASRRAMAKYRCK